MNTVLHVRKEKRQISTKNLYKPAFVRYIGYDYFLENGLITYGTQKKTEIRSPE